MAKPVTKWKATDGEIFDTEDEAKIHDHQIEVKTRFEKVAYSQMYWEDVLKWIFEHYDLKHKEEGNDGRL